MTKMRPTPAPAAPAAPSAAASRNRGPTLAFNPSAAVFNPAPAGPDDPTWSNFLEPRTSLISADFDGDDNRGTHPTTLPPTFGGK